jgi:hypothetical protein
MACTKCLSGSQVEASAEINIHFQGLRNIEHPGILVFPKILVCLDCGISHFIIPEHDLSHFGEGIASREVSAVNAREKMRRPIAD